MTDNRITYLAAICGFLILFATALSGTRTDFNMTGVETSRMAAVQAMIDHGETSIDNSCFRTVDKGTANGRYYSDKPPLLTFGMAGLYAVLRGAGLSFENHYALTVYLFNLCNGLFYNLWIVGLAWLLMRRRHCPPTLAVILAFLSLFSTLAWSYSVSISNHLPAAVILLGLALLLEQRLPAANRAAAAGLLTGVLFNLELVLGVAFFPAVLLWLWLCRSDRRNMLRAATVFLLAGPLLFAGTNFIHHGSPLPLYLSTHHPDLTGKNYFSYAFHVLFGFEGFFLYTPALLFLAAALPFRRSDAPHTPEPARNAMLAGSALALLIYLAGTSDFGGWCYGFRFLVPLAPLLFLYAADAVRQRRKRWLAVLFAVACGWGMVTAAVGLYDPWCAGYEGSSSTPGSVHQRVRNSFCANLFAWSFERDPESPVSRFFYYRFYGAETARHYLFNTYENSKNIEMMRYMLHRIRQEESQP
ncbi:MAG: hypothetical protein IJC73_02360 [Lentisphaeria bacterium]|nr:hypothetical protein [Lentisphaeria bacterium]